jgi:hypothetical protein
VSAQVTAKLKSLSVNAKEHQSTVNTEVSRLALLEASREVSPRIFFNPISADSFQLSSPRPRFLIIKITEAEARTNLHIFPPRPSRLTTYSDYASKFN